MSWNDFICHLKNGDARPFLVPEVLRDGKRRFFLFTLMSCAEGLEVFKVMSVRKPPFHRSWRSLDGFEREISKSVKPDDGHYRSFSVCESDRFVKPELLEKSGYIYVLPEEASYRKIKIPARFES